MAKEKVKEKVNEGPKIYLGPNIAKYGLTQGQVYLCEDELIKTIINEYPGTKKFFISVDENLGKVKQQIREKGTVENLLYNELKLKINGGK